MLTSNLVTVDIFDYASGEKIGTYEVSKGLADSYELHCIYDPVGVVKASFFGSVLPVPYNTSVYAFVK